MTVSDRPWYLKDVLNGLAGCEGVRNHEFMFIVEPSEEYDKVEQIILGFMRKVKRAYYVIKNYKRKGLVENTFYAIDEAFRDEEEIMFLEEDVLPLQDSLTYVEWGLREYKNVSTVSNITLDNHAWNGLPKFMSKQQTDVVYRRRHFACWGWAMWRDRWENLRTLSKKLAKPNDSWAWGVKQACARLNLMEIYPEVSRSIHIGINGFHTKGKKFEEIAKGKYSMLGKKSRKMWREEKPATYRAPK